MRQDIKELIQSCIHLIISRSGELSPRPIACALPGEKPNEVVHADFIYLGPADQSNLKYVLINKEDIGLYASLWSCHHTDSNEARIELVKWISYSGERSGWYTIRELSSRHQL